MTYMSKQAMEELIRTRTEKRCRLCGCILPLAEFHADKSRADGHEYRCKSCSRAQRGKKGG